MSRCVNNARLYYISGVVFFLIVMNLTHLLEGAENKEAQEKKINKMKKAKHHCYFGWARTNKTCQWFLMRRNLVWWQRENNRSYKAEKSKGVDCKLVWQTFSVPHYLDRNSLWGSQAFTRKIVIWSGSKVAGLESSHFTWLPVNCKNVTCSLKRKIYEIIENSKEHIYGLIDPGAVLQNNGA